MCNPCLGHLCYLCLGTAQEPRPTSHDTRLALTYPNDYHSSNEVTPDPVAAANPGVGTADTRRPAGLGSTNRFICDPLSRSYRGAIHSDRPRFLRRRFFYF